MKKRISFLALVLSLIFPALALANYRIAYSADGNQHDADDWHASVLALAMIAESGNKHRLVHFDYNNHLGDNDWQMSRQHRQNVEGAIQRYGYDRSRFFDDQSNVGGAVSSIARAVNQSSANSRLFLICAGPMEVCYRGIAAANDGREQYVTVVSHSWWNENHNDTGPLQHRWSDIQRDFNVQTVQIPDQNNTAFRSQPGAWDWLRQQNHGDWLHQMVARNTGAGDASDAGMVYYVLRNRANSAQWASMSDIRALFSSSNSDSGSGGNSGGNSGGSGGWNGGGGNGINPPGGFVSLQARNSWKCPQVRNWSRANGTAIEQRGCANQAIQKWRFESTWGGRYAMRSQHSNKCLQVNGKSWSNGAGIDQWNCHKGENQQFDLIPRGNGWFNLRVKHSNKCLTVAGGATGNGAPLNQWNCNGGSNQQFRFRSGN